MRRTSVSRPHHLVCPACGYGALRPRGPLSRSVYYCESCWCSFGGATVGTRQQIAALPDAVGKHACEECGQPEMRSLADGTFYCPACRSEVVPTTGPNLLALVSHVEEEGEHRRVTWISGRGGHSRDS
jgi:ribosomal protein L37AE/L43A